MAVQYSQQSGFRPGATRQELRDRYGLLRDRDTKVSHPALDSGTQAGMSENSEEGYNYAQNPSAKSMVIAEHDNQHLHPVTLNAIAAASLLQSEIVLLVAGFSCDSVVQEAAQYRAVSRILWVDDLVYQYQLAENLAELVVQVAQNCSHILAAATTFGKDLMPRVAALFDVAQVSDMIQVIDAKTFVRPIYAGNALATVTMQDEIKVITVRATAFDPVTKTAGYTAPTEKLDIIIPAVGVEFKERTLHKTEHPELSSARVIVSGGRGLQSAENFTILIDRLADQLGAAIGASRAAVDAGFVPNDYQIGQTGKVVAPELYFAIGISGAIQHLAGMKDSQIIVAINKDPDAPIFQVADYGLVGDIFTIIPELEKELEKIGYRMPHKE
jgi:electron transfer flavoprotein alpha subunit